MSESNTLSWTSQPTDSIEQQLRNASTDPSEQRALLVLLTDRLTCELLAELDTRPGDGPDQVRHTSRSPGHPPAGWHADPSGRHQVRWWDGQRWTEHASDSGRTVIDPI